MITNKKTASTITSLVVLLSILLSACGPTTTPAPTADVNAIYTQAAGTVVAGLTQTSAAMPTATPVPPTSTPQPSPTTPPTAQVLATATQSAQTFPTAPIPTPVPVDPATAQGCYNASYIADVTILYSPAFKPGDKFTKTWRIKNTGTCDWSRAISIAFISGDRFGAATTAISQKVLAGNITEISLAMVAPSLTGVVTSNWRLITDLGKPFGPVLSTSITLPAAASSAVGCLNSALVSDVTIPSGTKLNTGEAFTKTWRVQNTGTCEWNRDFKITFVGGDLLGSDTTKIRQFVAPGATTEISLGMTAPGTAGTVTSSWQMASDTGKLFGQLFVISIEIK